MVPNSLGEIPFSDGREEIIPIQLLLCRYCELSDVNPTSI